MPFPNFTIYGIYFPQGPPLLIEEQTQSTDHYPTTKYAEIFPIMSFSIVSNLPD
jgi:hypothetical protein